jgi:hypothetical protein
MKRYLGEREKAFLNQSYVNRNNYEEMKAAEDKAAKTAKFVSIPTGVDFVDIAAGVGKHPTAMFIMNRHNFGPYDYLEFMRRFDLELSIEDGQNFNNFFCEVIKLRRRRAALKKYQDLFCDYSPKNMQELVAKRISRLIRANSRTQLGCIARYDASLEGLHFIWDKELTRPPGSRGRCNIYSYGHARDSVVVIGRGGYRVLYDKRYNPYGTSTIAHTHVSRMIEDHGDWYRARFVATRNNYPCHFTGTAKKNEINGKFYLDKIERPVMPAKEGMIQ